MQVTFHDINKAYREMHIMSKHFCEWENTRNGRAYAFQSPVLITHARPERRVLFDPVRDANPFFHYMECIWVLSGENDVYFPATFAKQIKEYSDDGKTIHGAYGYRWRKHFRVDQIDQAIDMLSNDRSTRRAVISMWDPNSDLGVDSKDLPCNTHLYFRVLDECLEMTICNRSNDMVWGALGANVVHFSVLQEYMAAATMLGLGRMHQFTNNLHIYEQHVGQFSYATDDFYARPVNRVEFTPDTIDLSEARRFVRDMLDTEGQYKGEILVKNAIPMLTAWHAYKDGNIKLAINYAGDIYDDDWREACKRWLQRRLK